ncbi:copper homeostasis protein CutC [Roseivirga sp.]|uniref:copper homeostasis protein CutC n=1 Tax=Roseivirga sp. TaxID=1964215 RepID=UPI003B8C252D
MRKLEVCANSIESALNAQNGGADRIELCVELSVGGLTPSKGMIQLANELLEIPIFVLIRPRSGGFHYSKMELEVMKEDVKFCAEIGCAGVVFGALTADRFVNQPATELLMDAAGFMDVTFHRAFDSVPNLFEAMDTLREMGVQRILTSGGPGNCVDNIDTIGELIEEAEDELIIMPGGGVRPENIALVKQTGAIEYHSSAIAGGVHSDLKVIKALKKAIT